MNKPLHPNQLRPGCMVRDFHVIRRLGVGGFAFVFLVEREGRRLSLKMAAQPASPEDEDRVDGWMRREVASLEHLEDPRLLPVLEWGRWPDPETGYAYFVTPYVRGSTFHVWRWRERTPLYRSVGVLCEHLRTLEALHARGVCHRDIKADNLLVRGDDDTPFLIDFGAAHLPWARALTEGLAPGTLYCQPPEAIAFLVSDAARRGARLEAHPTADLYAFGILLYETLTNCRPFSTRLSLDALLVAIATTPPRDPQQLVPEAPASLCTLAMSLLSKEAGQRPQSARAVREELERLRAEEGQSAGWQAAAQPPSESPRTPERFPGVDLLEEVQEERPASEPRVPLPTHPSPPVVRPGWRTRTRPRAIAVLGLALLAIGWSLLRVAHAPLWKGDWREESTAPERPALSDEGTQPVPISPRTSINPPSTPWVDPRLCTLFGLLGAAASPLAGCVTVPVQPDPAGYLAKCPPEARETPVKLGIKPDEQGSFLRTGTPVSDQPIEEGGTLSLKPGPVSALMCMEPDEGEELRCLKITGEAVTTPNRVYMQFDRVYLPEGTSLPICGVAVDGVHEYGIVTYGRQPFHGARVDPARVDKSPGSVVLNDPRFETVLQGPKGYYMPRVDMPPPNWR
jgi:serine/threonine protein kinase